MAKANGQNGSKYGAFELKKNYPRYFTIGMIIAIAFHFLGVGSYFLALKLQETEEDNIPVVRVMKYSELGPPPSIASEAAPQVAVTTPVAKPSVGIPVPVPDAKVSPEQTIATQQELSRVTTPTTGAGELGGGVQIQQDIKVEMGDEPDINAFMPVEKQPNPIQQPVPKYPELAQRAGIEGTVWVKILVDKEGKPKKAVVVKSDAEVFNESAQDAALHSLFTPAVMNNGPVTCWVVIPYRFKLK
jgi:protein TonB